MRRTAIFILLLLGVGVWLTGCSTLSGGQEPAATSVPASTLYGDQTQLFGQAFLSCNSLCANRGQCGSLDNGERVVLLGVPEPSVAFHARFAADNTAVFINGDRERQLINRLNEIYPLRFYQITLPENPEPAWVAGWCLQQ